MSNRSGLRKIEYRRIDSLVPATANPKRHDVASLTRSMGRFGIIDPIVEDGRTGTLISGHGRMETLAAAEEAGLPAPDGVRVVSGRWTIPVVVGWSSANEREASAALVAVNRLSEVGGWDDAALAVMLDDLDLDGIGYSALDLDALIASVGLPADLGDVTAYNGAPDSDDYYTPSWVFEKLGLEFDVDVASPPSPPEWVPARSFYTEVDDGLVQPWEGRVWMNPPYSNPTPWMEKFRQHGDGVALVPCSKGRWFVEAFNDPSLGVCSTPSNMKFVGGGISYHTVFFAAGEENLIALGSLGPVRVLA